MSETISTEEMNEEKITLATVVRILVEFRTEMNDRFSGLEKRMDNLEKRMDNLEKRMDSLESRVGNLENRVSNIEQNIEQIKLEIYDIRVRLDEISGNTYEALSIAYKDRKLQTLHETRLNYLTQELASLRQKMELT